MPSILTQFRASLSLLLKYRALWYIYGGCRPRDIQEVLMKKRRAFLPFVFLLIALVSVLLAETLVIQIQKTAVRKEPKFYAATLAEVKSGDTVEKLEDQDGWFKVKTAGGIVGWIHSSAATPKKVRLKALDNALRTDASAAEVTLAGKGFNKQVEEGYRAKNPELNFTLVEKMLKYRLSPSEIEAFLKRGKLGEFGRPQ